MKQDAGDARRQWSAWQRAVRHAPADQDGAEFTLAALEDRYERLRSHGFVRFAVPSELRRVDGLLLGRVRGGGISETVVIRGPHSVRAARILGGFSLPWRPGEAIAATLWCEVGDLTVIDRLLALPPVWQDGDPTQVITRARFYPVLDAANRFARRTATADPAHELHHAPERRRPLVDPSELTQPLVPDWGRRYVPA